MTVCYKTRVGGSEGGIGEAGFKGTLGPGVVQLLGQPLHNLGAGTPSSLTLVPLVLLPALLRSDRQAVINILICTFFFTQIVGKIPRY